MIRELKFHHRREMLPFLTREYPKGISRVIIVANEIQMCHLLMGR